MAVLALYLAAAKDKSLSEFLNETIFAGEEGTTVTASAEEIEGFNKFMETFKATLPLEQAAVEAL